MLVGDSQLLGGTNAQISRPKRILPKNADRTFDSLFILYFGHRIYFCQYRVQSAIEIKDLRTEASEKFPCGERDLLKQ